MSISDILADAKEVTFVAFILPVISLFKLFKAVTETSVVAVIIAFPKVSLINHSGSGSS